VTALAVCHHGLSVSARSFGSSSFGHQTCGARLLGIGRDRAILTQQSSELPLPALTDFPELVGFFSYSRDDDRDSEGGLTLLRRRIQSELRGQLGRSEKTLRLFQDAEAIPPRNAVGGRNLRCNRAVGPSISKRNIFDPFDAMMRVASAVR
jgi:hypothetical protein